MEIALVEGVWIGFVLDGYFHVTEVFATASNERKNVAVVYALSSMTYVQSVCFPCVDNTCKALRILTITIILTTHHRRKTSSDCLP